LPRYRVQSPNDVLRWIADTRQTRSKDKTVIATFIIDTEQRLWINDRHSEHVVCAAGEDVLSAGEMTFFVDKLQVEVVEVTNQSTGYRPEPESWSIVANALVHIGLPHPEDFTTSFLFRRCDACGTTNIVKEMWFECGVCQAALSREWNYGK
jgi:hypothetical protein